jgi:hypothetical protein
MPTAADYGPLDEALSLISKYGPELVNGNFNHAPMVVEALCALGRPEAVMPWLGRYEARMTPRPRAVEVIGPENWQSALGRRERFADWEAHIGWDMHYGFEWWQHALDAWSARLAPGFSAAATHGAIRVGHAARGLARGATERREMELADALASWAASYAELPQPEARLRRGLTPSAAIRQVPIVPRERRRPGNITAALGRLAEFPEFAPTIDLIDIGENPAELLGALTEAFARVFLANADSTFTFIVFVHGVTAIHALGNIVQHVEEPTARLLARYAWQAGCGLLACFGGGTALAEAVEPVRYDWDELIDRAVVNGDEHMIKFTEACLFRHQIAPSPVYPAAIRHALALLERR